MAEEIKTEQQEFISEEIILPEAIISEPKSLEKPEPTDFPLPPVDIKNIIEGARNSKKRIDDTDEATITINWQTSNSHSVTLGGNRTIAWANPLDGQVIVLTLRQDGTGSRTITWPSTVAWPDGTAPTLTTTANKTDVFTFVRHDTDDKEYGQAVGYNY